MQTPSSNIPNILSSQNDTDEIDLRELLNILWASKWTIIITTVIFTIAAITYALLQPNIYKSDILLAPRDSGSNNSNLSQMANQFSGIASLAGVDIGSTQITQADLAIQILKSRKFISQFVQNHNLLVPIMAAKNWDLKTNKLILDKDIYNPTTKRWLRKPKGLHKAKPSILEVYKKFTKQILVVTTDKETGLYTISISFYSPYISKKWATWLVQDINKVMRERTITETSKNLKYLKQQLNKTSIADMQSTFYNLIEAQTKQLMLAQVQNEFVFKTLDPAVVPEVKDSPKRIMISVIGFVIGLLISIIQIFTKSIIYKNNSLNKHPLKELE